MSTLCDSARARMMELLYGELAGAELAEVEGHLGGCARCQAELAGFKRTRAALRGALEQAPPARVHDDLLRAAAAQATARAKPAAASPTGPVGAPIAPRRESVWEWLRRRWALPTLATVGAVAVFLLASQMFLTPEKMMQGTGVSSRARPVEPEVPAPAAPEGLSAPTPGEPPASQPAPAAEQAAGGRRRPDPASDALAGMRRRATDASGERASSAPKGAPAARREGSSADVDHRLAQKLATGRQKPNDERKDEERAFAAPPPPSKPAPVVAAQPRVQTTAATRPAGKKEKGSSAGSLDDLLEGGDTKPAPPRSAPPPTTDEPASVALSARDEAEAPPPARGLSKSKEADRETPVQRAERLFASGQWTAAAAAYRQLLQAEPRNAAAPRWRQRLATAEANARNSEALQNTP